MKELVEERSRDPAKVLGHDVKLRVSAFARQGLEDIDSSKETRKEIEEMDGRWLKDHKHLHDKVSSDL